MTALNHESDPVAFEAATCLSLIDGPAIDSYLEDLRNFKDGELILSLMANQALPPSDPAGYLTARHAASATSEATSSTLPYDFGVAFAGGLIRSTILKKGSEAQIPVITESDNNPINYRLVNDYLDKSRKTPVKQLIRNGDLELPDAFVGAINLLAQKVSAEVMVGFTDDGSKEEVLRGAYDYFRVIDILENPEAETARRGFSHFMMRRLRRLSPPKQPVA